MSNTKRLAIILAVEFVLIVIGLINVSIISQNLSVEIPDYRLKYMVGYSMPILIMGFVAFLSCVVIFREKKIQIAD